MGANKMLVENICKAWMQTFKRKSNIHINNNNNVLIKKRLHHFSILLNFNKVIIYVKYQNSIFAVFANKKHVFQICH